ncbi:TolC family protein [Flavobacterium maritimum]|uniref:TolC family protein n=1 Tax=Flavobacterium maritimum TaxID=3149042 RepID=UPI0032B483F4
MKISPLMLFSVFFIGISSIEAQEKTSLTLDEAIHLAWVKSNEVTLANTKVNSKKYELKTVKNNQYPDLKASGQYQRLTNASVDIKINQDANPARPPVVDQMMIGQVNASIPVFAGFKIQNSIKMSENLYEAETATANQTKEEVAMKVINQYANLYKAQKTIELLKENQKSAQQRVFDFTEMEKNGIIPRNDLLKAQLQVSRIQLTIDEAENNLKTVNFYLVTLLKLPSETKLEIRESDFDNLRMDNIPTNDQLALENRKDLQAVQFQGKASEANIKMARGGYYPAISLIGGYTALDLANVVTVQNAMNFGVGLSYDLGGILKNGASVKLAESKALEVQNSEALLKDYIKVEVQKSIEDYDLALKQSAVLDQAVEQASENYRIIKDKYESGLSDTNDLLEADVDQLTSRINKMLTKVTIIQKYYELLSVTGQLSQTFNLSKI